MVNAFQSGPCIFVSHSSKDDEFGTRLVQDLRRSLGSEEAVWYDSQGGLSGGDVWWEVIVRELTARPVFIVVLSPQALNSKWVKDEIRIAWKQKNGPVGKHIIPIHYQACAVPEDLDTLQVISFLPPASYESAFQRLATSINLIVRKIAQQNTATSSSNLIAQKPTLDAAASKTIGDAFKRLLGDDEEPQQSAFTLPARSWLPLPGKAPVVEKTKEQWIDEGDNLYNQNRYQDALNAYEQALRLDDKLTLAHYGKATCLYAMKNLTAALTAYERAIQLNPSYDRPYLGKGRVLLDMQRYPDALAAFDEFIRLSPHYAFVYVDKGDLLMTMLRPRDALNTYEQALRIDPNFYPALKGKDMALQAIHMNPFSNPWL
ncbi:MAG TPA: toll/interleukin-1 receptor domain-containing protein [Ktedonobacteraceae bacterium]|nr:toll/interleukin-1 receptor domain-containing protein [Ktedonobacteraceae bacterium]